MSSPRMRVLVFILHLFALDGTYDLIDKEDVFCVDVAIRIETFPIGLRLVVV